MAFRLRSGNKSSFKSMGSSPVKKVNKSPFMQDDEEVKIPAQDDATNKINQQDAKEIAAERFGFVREIRQVPTRDIEAEDDPNFIGPRQEVVEEHHAKGEDYIVDDGQDKIGHDEDGRMIPVDDGEYKPEFNKNKLEYLESEVDDYLGNPMEKGSKKAWEIAGETNIANTQIPFSGPEEHANPDPLRHTLSAMYTSEKVGMIPANIMGIMHELTAKNTPAEHREDILNNFIGSIIGSVPFTSTEKKERLVQKLWEKGLLFSGRGENSYEREFLEEHKRKRNEEKEAMNKNEAIEEVKKLSDGL